MTQPPYVLALEPPRQDGISGMRADHARAATASGESAAGYAEWVLFDALKGITEHWQTLAEHALEPNIFYEPDFAIPASHAFGAGAGAVLVWADRRRQRLIGLFPAKVERRRYGLAPSVLVGWTHPYGPLGLPIVDRDDAVRALAAWLAFLADNRDLPRVVLIPLMTVQGPLAALVRAAIALRGGRSLALGRHARAWLDPLHDRHGYLERAVPARKRKELRRQRRSLIPGAEAIATSDPAKVPQALDAFLELEAQGWKGRRGTAAAQNPVAHRFMSDAVTALARHGQAQMVQLLSNERPVAAAIVLRSGARAWFWKIAFDESVARASPGVQLTLELTQSLLDDETIAAADSCATPDHPMIGHIWRERLELCDLLIAPDARSAAIFACASVLERLRRRAIEAVKRARDFVARSRRSGTLP